MKEEQREALLAKYDEIPEEQQPMVIEPGKIAGYARLSFDKNETATRESARLQVKRQMDNIRRFVDHHWNAEISDDMMFVDNNISAAPGKEGMRPEFNRLMGAILSGEVTCVVSTEFERLARNDLETGKIDQFISDRQVRVFAIRGGERDLHTTGGKVKAVVDSETAKSEITKMKNRMRQQRRQQIEMGRWRGTGKAFGYKPNLKGVDPKEKALVEELCERILAGEGLSAIAHDWTERKIKTIQGATKWAPQVLRQIAINPRIAGLYYTGKSGRYQLVRGVKADWEPLVPEGVWMRVVAVLSDSTRRLQHGTTPKWLGAGVYKCGVCDEVMRATNRGDGEVVYRCASRTPGHPFHPAIETDAYVTECVIAALKGGDKVLALIAGKDDTDNELARIDSQLKEIMEKLDELAHDYHQDKLMTREAYKAESASHKENRDSLEKRRTRIMDERKRRLGLEGAAGDLIDSSDPGAVWEDISVLNRKRTVEALVTVVLHPRKNKRSRVVDPEEVVVTLLPEYT